MLFIHPSTSETHNEKCYVKCSLWQDRTTHFSFRTGYFRKNCNRP